MRWILAATLLIAACRREPLPAVAPSPAPVPPAPVAALIIVPAPPEPPPAEIHLPEIVPGTDWTALPAEVTRLVPQDLLLGDDQLFVGRQDGLWELAWTGQPRRQLASDAALGVVVDGATLLWLAAVPGAKGAQTLEIRRLDPVTAQDRLIARLPTLHCPDGKTVLAWQPSLAVAADGGACLYWVDVPWDPMRAARVRVDDDGRIHSWTWCGEELAQMPSACEVQVPAAATPAVDDEPFKAQVQNGHDTAIVSRDKPNVYKLLQAESTAFEPERRSPSGRWQVLIGNEQWGDLLHQALLLFDRHTGRLFPVRRGPWPPALTPEEMRRIALDFPTAEAIDVAWLAHSDVLLVAEDVVVPGVGGYHAGVLAR